MLLRSGFQTIDIPKWPGWRGGNQPGTLPRHGVLMRQARPGCKAGEAPSVGAVSCKAGTRCS